MLDECGTAHSTVSLGVLRSYAVRHGNGPLPSEGVGPAADDQREHHNPTNPWQGDFRTGTLDLVLVRYAIEVTGGVDGLVVTHLDALPGHSRWPLVTAYEDEAGRRLQRLPVATKPTPREQAALTRRLMSLRCRVERLLETPSTSLEDALVQRIENELKLPIVGRSHSPRTDALRLHLDG